MADNKKMRIRLYGEHLGYIGYSLYYSFLRICNIVDYSFWVKLKANEEFGVHLVSKESINELKELVVKNYYEDTADWLREKMREEISKKQV